MAASNAMKLGGRLIISRGIVLSAIYLDPSLGRPSITPVRRTVSPVMGRIDRRAILNANALNATARMAGQIRFSATPFQEIMEGQIRVRVGPVMPEAWAAIPASPAMMPAKLTVSTAKKG